MYGIQDKINQILRGAETIKKNSMNTTDAPRRPLRPEELFDEALKLKEHAEKAESEIARLRELLEKVLFELEKVPFQTPKLTAFTAHRLADRYREQLNKITK